MLAKRLLQKVRHPHSQHNLQHGSLTSQDLDVNVALHYGIPTTASILAFDPIQRLLAIGTLDGRIKVMGGDNIEGLLISPKQLPYKNLEFLHNQGFLVSVSNENDIEVWDLENRCITHSLQWASNVTAFSVLQGSYFMYIGDEYGLTSVLKYDSEGGQLLQLPYQVPANSITEASGIPLFNHATVVGVLPQPCSSGNRVLIAYETGLIALWDIAEARVVVLRGYKDLKLKDEELLSAENDELQDTRSDHEQEEKEISSLCWASSTGTIVAVGYVDGDVMLWNLSSASSAHGQQASISSDHVVKLQLSSCEKRIPVIVLHWSPRSKSDNDRMGQLFIYGGDEIGSEEVLTILSLEWPSGMETLKCVGRMDLTLNGSFADMILIPKAGAIDSDPAASLFVLTSPGQLHVYDNASLSALAPHPEKGFSVPSMQFPVTVPVADPCMTAAKLSLVSISENSSKDLSKVASLAKIGAAPSPSIPTKWPLTGGVPSQLSFAEDKGVERVYIGGYQDGSVRMWDATFSVLSLICVIEGEVKGIEIAGICAPVTRLEFSSLTSSLAVGNECGLVRVYRFSGSSEETGIHFVTQTKHEVHNTPQGKGLQCTAVFSILDSPVQTLQYANSGAKLVVGFDCGRVAMLDISTLSFLFLTNSVSASSSPVVSIDLKAFAGICSPINSPKHSGPKNQKDDEKEAIFILTRDSRVVVVDSATGNIITPRPMHPKKESTGISIYVLEDCSSIDELSDEKHPEQHSQESTAHEQSGHTSTSSEVKVEEVELHTSDETACHRDRLPDLLVLLCSENELRLYSLKSVIKGDKKLIHKVKLTKPCCWTATLKTEDERSYGLILLYQTGDIEVRSLPDLGVVGESSLMSMLRWSFRLNMNKTMSASNNGMIALVNGCELAFISCLACKNDFGIQESQPCLHDKVLAAAADAAINFSSYQKKKQNNAPGVLVGIIKNFKGRQAAHSANLKGNLPQSNFASHLESVFSRAPFSEQSTNITDAQEVVVLDIDDIEIDEPLPVVSTSSHEGKNDGGGPVKEREKLLEGANDDIKPRLRTPEEIMAKYRKAGDASAAASQARDKLVQRQEKLERLGQRTAELQSGAENFSSLADELVKAMEARKWWQI